jgi:hypothetical protein
MTIKEATGLRRLRDSSDALADHAELERRWAAEGYLFLRGVIDLVALEEARHSYMQLLVERGFVESVDGESVWTGARPQGPRALVYHDLGESVWKRLVSHPSFDRMIRAVLGEGPSWVPIVSYRAAIPAKPESQDLFAGKHQDGYFNEGIDFRICWVPLMEIPANVGGLAIAPGHHKDGFLHVDRNKTISGEAVPDELWLRDDYVPGDVLIFHHLTPHSGLVNNSNLVRLSMDVRVLPESAVQPVIGTISSVDDAQLQIVTDDGTVVTLMVDGDTYFRGIGPAEERLSTGDRAIASTDAAGQRAVLVRSAT